MSEAVQARAPLAIKNSGYRNLWFSTLQFWLAKAMEITTLGWLVLQLTDSPIQVALVGFCSLAPQGVLGLLSGALTDRFPRKRIIATASLLSVTATTLLASLIMTGWVETWQIFLLVTVQGFANALDFPARRAFMGDVLPKESFASGAAFDMVGIMAAMLIGPIAAGVLLESGGAKAAYPVIAALAFTNLVTVLLLPTLPKPEGKPAPFIRSTQDGARYSFGIPVIAGVLVITVILNILALPLNRLMPVFTENVLDVGPALLGILLGSQSAGSMIGSLALSVMPSPRRTGLAFTCGVLFMLTMYLAFSLSTWYPLSLLFYFIAGFGQSLFSSYQVSLLLNGSSAEMRGRVLGLLSLCIGTQFVGSLLLGAVIQGLGPARAVTVCTGAAYLLVLLVVARSRALRS